ncbi:transposable element Tcb2 transposase [Trichonephila clavipes]|nr:transposable element Tcb2 transposase [Trichonephila clavipes]
MELQWNGTRSSSVTIRNRFNLSSSDNRVRVWRSCGERLNAAFALQRHTGPTAGVMAWSVIAYDTRPPLLLIHGTKTVQWYAHDLLQPHVFPLMAGLPGDIFQQDNARTHIARMSQDCLRHITTLPWFVTNRAFLGSFGMANWTDKRRAYSN